MHIVYMVSTIIVVRKLIFVMPAFHYTNILFIYGNGVQRKQWETHISRVRNIVEVYWLCRLDEAKNKVMCDEWPSYHNFNLCNATTEQHKGHRCLFEYIIYMNREREIFNRNWNKRANIFCEIVCQEYLEFKYTVDMKKKEAQNIPSKISFFHLLHV